MRIAYCAIKFFYLHVVGRDWHILNILKAQSERGLPAVLTREEIDSIFQRINTFHNYVFLTTVYSCGLRLQEALYLETGDIDAGRRLIHVHRGKGPKVYLHLTQKGQEDAFGIINTVMQGFDHGSH